MPQVVPSTTIDPSIASNLVAADSNNPLRQFRSYAYQFQIIACESTEVSNYLTGTPNPQNPNAPITPPPDAAFERPDPQNPRATITCPAGKYVIVIDTRTDVDIIIEDVQWGTTFIGSPNTSNSAVALSTVMTDGTIDIIEPRGVNFLNLLASVGDALDVDMICMPWLLRVQFFGQTDEGITTYLPPSESARAFPFVPVDITGSVDVQGTKYKMDIVGVTNGICYNPNFNALCDNITFYTRPGETLAAHLARFQKQIQDMYDYQRAQITEQLRGKLDLSNAANIEYVLVLEPGSDVLQGLTDFGSNPPPQATDKYGVFPIKGTKEGGIAEVITKLLGTSQTWMAKAAQGNPPNASDLQNTEKRYTFKITQKFQSTSPSTTTKGNVTVFVIVSEYKYDTQVVQTTYGGGQTEIMPVNISPDQVLTYNYIYTGKNTDIIDMNMDLSLGLSLLQTLSTAKSLTNQTVDTQSGPIRFQDPITGTSLIGPTNIHGRVRKGTPIFAPFQWINTFFKEAEAMQNTATADAIWKSFANYQSVSTKLTIHGNPLILGKIIDPNRTTPNYLQVNIKMPSTPDDIWEYQLTGNQTPGGYYKPFWYTGYYLLVSATNKFSGGLFTQELELVSMPQVAIQQGSVAATEQAEDAPDQGRQFFFNKQPTAAPATTTPPTAPVTPAPSTNTSNTLAKPTTNPAYTDPQGFVANYWNYALQASRTTGLDPDFALAQAAVETGWGKEPYTQNYSTMFNIRAYKTPDSFWDGAVIQGTGFGAPHTRGYVPPFRAYNSPTESFLDQHGILSRIYPLSASAPSGPNGISQYANGLINGKGGLMWTVTNPQSYPPAIIDAYNAIQGYKSNLGIQNGQMYAGGPEPTTATTPTANLLAVNTTTAPSVGTNTTAVSISSTYATGRTIAQASIAQKTPIFT